MNEINEKYISDILKLYNDRITDKKIYNEIFCYVNYLIIDSEYTITIAGIRKRIEGRLKQL